MRGESSSSSGDGEGGTRAAAGEFELYRSQGADLYLIDGEGSLLLQSGDFTLHLVKHSRSPLAAVVAMVGDIQWPVGKDSPVMKVGARRFTYALPAFMYGLGLSEITSAADLQRLDTLLQEYSLFELRLDFSAGLESQEDTPTLEQQAANYWTRMGNQIRSRGWAGASNSMVMEMGHLTALNSQRRMAEEVGLAGAGSGGAVARGLSPRMIKTMQHARRMSAVAKLFAKMLEKGAISATNHVEAAMGGGLSGGGAEPTVASVDAVAKVVEAVETAGRTVLELAGSAGTEFVQRRYGDQARQTAAEGLDAVGSIINSAWTLNRLGLRVLFHAIAASTAISAGAGSSSDARASSSFGFSSRRSTTIPDIRATSGYIGNTLRSSPSTSQSVSSLRPPHHLVADSPFHFHPPPLPPPPPAPPPPFRPPPIAASIGPIFRHSPPPVAPLVYPYPPPNTTAAPPTTAPFRQPLPLHRTFRPSFDAPHRLRPPLPPDSQQ